MSYHRDLTREIAALDDLIENHLNRGGGGASPEQVAILNELKQILTLKKEFLRHLIIEAKPDRQHTESEAARYLSDDIV
jgi:hypothetical protein